MYTSIVIPAHNEAAIITRTLESILEGGFETASTEIIVVGSACTDDTLEVTETFLGTHPAQPTHRLLESDRGQQTALNTGIVAARGSEILCVDADVTLDADTLPSMVNALHTKSQVCLVGSLAVADLTKVPVKLPYLATMIVVDSLRRQSLGVRKSVQGACLGFRGDEALLFPESVTPQDVWISAFMADKYGLDAIDVNMNAKTYWTAPDNWRDYFLLAARYKVAHQLLYDEFPDLAYTVKAVTDYIEADRSQAEVIRVWEDKCITFGIDIAAFRGFYTQVQAIIEQRRAATLANLRASSGVWEPVLSTKS